MAFRMCPSNVGKISITSAATSAYGDPKVPHWAVPIESVGKAPSSTIPRSEVGSPGHDEWLLDEALLETFPASDPISPSRPSPVR